VANDPTNATDPSGLVEQRFTRDPKKPGTQSDSLTDNKFKISNKVTGAVNLYWNAGVFAKGQTNSDGRVVITFDAKGAKLNKDTTYWIQLRYRYNVGLDGKDQLGEYKQTKEGDKFLWQLLSKTRGVNRGVDSYSMTSVKFDGLVRRRDDELSISDRPTIVTNKDLSEMGFVADDYLVVNNEVRYHVQWKIVVKQEKKDGKYTGTFSKPEFTSSGDQPKKLPSELGGKKIFGGYLKKPYNEDNIHYYDNPLPVKERNRAEQ
jgi:hypothetical protein